MLAAALIFCNAAVCSVSGSAVWPAPLVTPLSKSAALLCSVDIIMFEYVMVYWKVGEVW
jgi:hypothetical protein